MRRSFHPLRIIFVATLGLSPLVSAWGQEPAADQAPAVPVEIRGADLPRYTVVESFFDQAIFFRRGEWPLAYDRLLQELGIASGSEAAKRFDRAVTEAEAVREMPTVNPEIDDPEEYWAFQMRALGEKARALGHVYATLVRDLRKLGSSHRLLQEYLEIEVRPSTSLHTADEWPHDVFRALGSFDEEVDAVLTEEKP